MVGAVGARGLTPTSRHALPAVEFELFSSSFCGTCDMTRALVDQAVRVLPTARVREHNVADSGELADRYDIGVTPTIIVRNADGDEVMRAAGVPTIHHLLVAAGRAMESAGSGSGRGTPDEA